MSTHIFLHLPNKLLEVEDSVYQKMASYCESDGQWLLVFHLYSVQFHPCFFSFCVSASYSVVCTFHTLISFCFASNEYLCLSKTIAVKVISYVRDGQGNGEPESNPEAAAVDTQRIVLLAQNQWGRSEKSSKADMTSHLLHSTVALPVKSDDRLKYISTSESDSTWVLPEPSVLSRSSNCFLDGYTGTKPLIGEGRS